MKQSWKKKLVASAAAGVLALAIGPVAAFGASALTADTTLTVSGLDNGDKVSFYQIIEQDTAENGSGWKFVDALDAEGGDPSGPDGIIDGTDISLEDLRAGANADDYDDFKVITGDMANKIAAAVSEKVSAFASDMEAADNQVVLNLRDGLQKDDPTPVGLYMAVVTDPVETDIVYKPIFVSADYDQGAAHGTVPEHDNTNAIELEETTEDVGGTGYQDDPIDGTTSEGVFKKSKLTLEKEAGTADDRLMNAGVGDVLPFTITTNMPSYTQNFEGPVFKITDELTTGLELCKADGSAAAATDITVEVEGYGGEGEPPLSSTNDYTVTKDSDTKFTVEFLNNDPSKTPAKDGILYTVLGNPKVTITYYAKVTDANAAAQVNQMDNNVRLDFSNAPEDTTGAGTLKDRTRHYTFSIDANVLGGGNGPDGESTTSEIRKIAVDANGQPIYTTETKSNKDTVEEENPDVYNWLQGAKFELTKKYVWKDADAAQGTDTYGMAGDFEALQTPVKIQFDANKIAGGDKDPESDANGYIAMKGLDAGIYELIETSSPLGYSFDPSMKYVITITPLYANDSEQDPTFTDVPNKILSGYTVKVEVKQGNDTKGTAETTYTSETAGDPATPVSFIDEVSEDDDSIENPTGVITTTDTTSETALIMNKELGLLPATGGSGIFFYVGVGCAIMLLAVGLGMLRRRRMQNR